MAKRKEIFVTDKEVASILRVSQPTLSRIIRGSFYRPGDGKSRIDINLAKPEFIGNARRWRVNRLASVLNITEEELLERIS